MQHPYLRSNAGVITFWRQPWAELVADYDAATLAKHGVADWLARVGQVDAVFRIYLASDPAPDDPDHWLKRELYVFGHPRSNEPLMCLESTVRM